ncbi:conserved hypothetical protein (plasmid) [Rhizobium leguminosarum bv. trifolii WSM2304]|uniref:Transcriptional regulator n=1 Tax=Rhizobium leguminosarum bv. trifolii (strain WSM2304) TaxID=395492 RepID=A0ABF7QYW8_RHILW|nr:hypothetical protein [Rhizobium leguminosarum]ACI59524.1 conserved hypothetical protein [Rhizobium leguminosarum bv. trifolii WSM2304]
MASPWKFLARLISPGREQKKEDGSASEATPDASATAGLADAAASESVNGADRPASDETHRQAVAVSPQPVHSEKAEKDGPGEADREGTRNEGAAVPALSGGLDIDVTAARGVTDLKRAVEVAPRKQRSRGKKAGAISHVSHADEMSLDEEIWVLRGQLAGKLKLQNAQLRKMLERFER